MDILEFAMKMELDGKAFYDKNARSTSDPELTRIFQHLAEEEERHYQFFKSMKEGNHEEAFAMIDRSNSSLDQAKNIFNELAENSSGKSFGDDELTAWMEALEIEEKAESFYREKAAEEKDDAQKLLLKAIADEEQTHVYMIDSIITYLKFPEAFSDSAQFKNFQSLEGH